MSNMEGKPLLSNIDPHPHLPARACSGSRVEPGFLRDKSGPRQASSGYYAGHAS